MKENKQPKNNAVTIKQRRSGKIVIDTKHAEIVNVEVASINSMGGLSTTKFVKEKAHDSIKRIAMANDNRYSQNFKARNGQYKAEAQAMYESESKKKPFNFWKRKEKQK